MSISVVVCGYDNYSVGWSTFKYAFDKYWPNCKWDKYFITNHLNPPAGFKVLKTGKEAGWGDKVLMALPRVKSDIIFWMMEDFWLTGPVDNTSLLEFGNLMEKNKNIDHITLLPPSYGNGEITPKKEFTKVTDLHSKLWYLRPDSNYRASVAQSFWRKDIFEQYIKYEPNATPWTFENTISAISNLSKNLYLGIIDPYIFPLPNYSNPHLKNKDDIVIKGKWTSAAYEYATREHLNINFKYHPNGEKNF